MKALATVLACLCVVLAVACVSLIAARPLAASAPDKPAAAADDKPAAPSPVGRFSWIVSKDEWYLFDSATGDLWKHQKGWREVYTSPDPVKAANSAPQTGRYQLIDMSDKWQLFDTTTGGIWTGDKSSWQVMNEAPKK
jgi:hypothetical protein